MFLYRTQALSVSLPVLKLTGLFGTTLSQYLKTKRRTSGTNLNVNVEANRRLGSSLAGLLLPQWHGSYARRSSTPRCSSGLLVPTPGSGPGSAQSQLVMRHREAAKRATQSGKSEICNHLHPHFHCPHVFG